MGDIPQHSLPWATLCQNEQFILCLIVYGIPWRVFTLRSNVRRSCIRKINLAGCLRWIGGEETRVRKASGRFLKQSRQGSQGLHKDAGSGNGKGGWLQEIQ